MALGKFALRKFFKRMASVVRKRRDNGSRIALLRRMPKAAVCAEIGVWKGDFSELIRSETSPSKLHLIDPWEFQEDFPERMYGGTVAKNQKDMDRIYEGVRTRFSEFSNIIINRGKSDHALREFEDGYFDWVYIDGNHYYDYVLSDLRICFSKVKRGGVIAGDDYTWGEKEGFPVKRAVQDFLEEIGLRENFELIGAQFLIRT